MTLCAPLLFLACFAVVHLCTTSSVLGLEVHRVRRLLRTSSSSSSSGCWVYRSRRCYRGVLQQHCCDGGTRRAACGVSAALLLVNACDAVSATDARTASERSDCRLYHNSRHVKAVPVMASVTVNCDRFATGGQLRARCAHELLSLTVSTPYLITYALLLVCLLYTCIQRSREDFTTPALQCTAATATAATAAATAAAPTGSASSSTGPLVLAWLLQL
eukprot:20982-Heterococcus_DN1.PRE.1